ncbi:MAG: hypothetical protein ABFQ95_07515 [Pseudomonadota bacterium]
MADKQKNNEVHKNSFFLRQRVKLGTMLLVLSCFVYLIYLASNQFYAAEKSPQLYPNLPQQNIQFGHGAVKVNTGIYIKEFTEFDTQTNTFAIDAVVWFEFNPNLITLYTLGGFAFDPGEIIEKSPPQTRLIKGKIFAAFNTRVRFSSHLRHEHFPFADHRIFLRLKLDAASPENLHFETKRSFIKISKSVQPFGWTLKSYEGQAGFFEETLSGKGKNKTIKHPQVIFSFDFAKPGLRKVLIILGPGLLLFLLGLMALIIRTEWHGKHIRSEAPIDIAIGSLIGLLFLRLVIETVSPDIGYFVFADQMYLIFFLSTFIILFVTIYEYNKAMPRALKATIFYSIQFIVLFFFYWFMRRIL